MPRNRRVFSEPLHVSGGGRVGGLCALAGILLAASGYVWGPAPYAVVGTGLAGVLVWLSVIDIQRHILPNALTFPLIAAGLALSAWSGQFVSGLTGAIAGYAVLAGIGWAYLRQTGHEGLGLGDAKLFAGAGAWLGWEALPGVMLVASGSALLLVSGRALIRRKPDWRTQAIAFGPFIAAGFWLIWLSGPLSELS